LNISGGADMASPFLMGEQSALRRMGENVKERMIFVLENNFACTMFAFVQNGKFLAKISKFAGGIRKQTAKSLITSSREGESTKAYQPTQIPSTGASAYRQGDKGPTNAHPKKKGRDASGASEGAEALIASSDSAQPMSASAIQDLSAKGAPL